ncbi:uncharacterized protein LOC129280086 [Lytechinus pictus]|uniref:uncharacterized protein LOC129280086 n=1 Tax=Lytechinus pictus TaxID=7653 RepID=UPI0030BA24BC
MDESTAKEAPVSKTDILKSQRHQRRGAKGKLTRIGHALKSLIEERRPISEVQEIYERYLLAYEELQNRHESFSELIEDDDEYDMEERWMDECQQSFLSHQISFRDYCKGETEKNVSRQKLRKQMTNEQPSDDNSEASSDETASNAQQDGSHTQSLQIRNVQKRVGSMFKMEKPKMPTFNGNVRDYCIFKADFQHALGEVFDERDALMILRSCLQGKPLQMIQGIGRDFKAAWEQLDMVYGDPRLVADAIIHDITKFRSLKPGEDDRFCEFVNIVRRSYNVLKEIGKENDMNNSHMLAIMEKKLTPEDRKIWFRNQELGEASSTFEKFLQFLTLELKARMRSAAPVRGEVKASVNFMTKKPSPSTNNQERKFDRCWLCRDDSHWTDQCKSFLSKSFKERMQLVKENKACFACLKKATYGHRMSTCKRRRRCTERVNGEQCKYYHHPLLHNSSDVREVGVACVGAKEALLPVVTVEVAEKKTWKKCNMLLDCGAQLSIIKQSLADKLKLKGKEVTIVISKLGGVEEEVITNEYKVSVKELGGRNSLPVTVISLPHISTTDSVPEEYLQSAAKQLKIDRKMFNRHGGEIDLLVGSDHPKFHGGESKETHNFTARHSPVGWVILGTLPHRRMESSKVLHVQLAKPVDLTEFWTTESMGVKDIDCQCQPTGMTKADKEEYDMIERSCVKEGNQWQVSYPWIRDPNKLPDNRWLAEKMLEATERRLLKNPDHAKAYQEQMTQLVEMGFARKLSDNEVSGYSGPVHYIGHHAVVRPEKKSTPVRIVFNSSASYQGHSLNEYWHKGPDMLNSLFGVLMKFRDHSVAVSGDISKMYHRVKVPVIDQHVHRYLWRDLEVERKPDVYIKLVVTFGDKPSPAMAQIALRKTAEVAEKESPKAAQILKESTYMDDICFSTPTEEEAIQLTDEIDKALGDGGFNVKGWVSNKNIRPGSQNEMELLSKLSNEKVLGVVWNQHNDSFSYKSTLDRSSREEKSSNNEGKWTKRKILSQIARVFDPLGFVSPFIVRAKMGMQRLWEKGYKWDERLPEEQQKWWINFFNEMKELSEAKLDRSLTPPRAIDNPILCVFSDASEAAFGCCAYLRWQIADGSFTTRFVAARSRLAPLKRLTIPRLELQAALMAARLFTAIKEETTLKLLETIFMTDSLITLAWIHSQSRMYKSFVSSRVGEIQSASNPENWRYVPGNMNPANKISRGLAVRDLSKEWEHGPEFLFKPIDDWPEDKSLPVQVMMTRRGER